MDIRCQQFTSEEIAQEMLDLVGYKQNLYGKSLLENSCGEGNILCLAVERYIQDALNGGRTSEEIVHGLEQDIFGAEIVESTYKICIDNLNTLAGKYGLYNIRWNILNGDVLECPFDRSFDFIVGNPPYISYRNLEQSVREFIKLNYKTCKKGKPDYCYAFIENAIKYLAVDGNMVYLIPNSIYKNVYAQDLRDMILEYIVEIRDYPNKKLFKHAMTSSAVMLLQKTEYIPKLKYINVPKNEQLQINKDSLHGKWIFDISKEYLKTVCFGDYFKASMAIATQRNNVFVIDEETRRNSNIERGGIRLAVSPRNQKYGNKEFIIFPYKVRNHVVINYQEEEFKQKYPRIYAYLEEQRAELDKRDADKSAQWFEYGRSQAVQNMNKRKLLISTVVTNEINVYEVNNRAVPYAGIYIISDKGYDLTVAKRILESEEFLKYIRGIGTPASGSSLRITANDINKFRFSRKEFF